MRSIVALTSALAACLLTSAGAVAADPGFCDGYARAAINQARLARQVPPCAPGAYGARWSMDYRTHYGWCLGARYRDAESERQARGQYLAACRYR